MRRGPPLPRLKHRTIGEALAAASTATPTSNGTGPVGLTFLDALEQERHLSFAELRLRARRAAAGMAALGIRPGDRVALVLPTGVDFMDAFFGALLAGAVPVPLYPPVRLGRLDEFHGRTARLLPAVYHPGPLALLPPEAFLARPALWLRAIARTRATLTVAPNFAFGLCAKRVRDEELQGADLSCLRLVLNGAEPIAPAALRRFCERFARFGFDRRALMPVYGLSEASLAVTFSPPGRGPRTVRRAGRELASVGAPGAGVEVSIRGEDGRELPDGAIGAIHVRGPSVMRGYFQDVDATAQALRDGWLDTGDLGFVEAGELIVSGRAKGVVGLVGP